MRIALFSDIHANLPALEATLANMDEQNLDALYCLGDLVGYATWPNEVVTEIRRRKIPTIAGNYDEGVGQNIPECGCAYKTDFERELGQQSINYTNSIVTQETRNYLRMLPRHLRVTFMDKSEEANKIEMLLVHGSPRKINEYLFEDRTEKSFLRMMEEAQTDLLFFGHTHKPYHRVLPYEREGKTRYRHAINIGSVGKPKDGDPRSCYVILELTPESSLNNPESIKVEFVRVAYDIEKAATAIEESPLPNEFAGMLRNA
ncbi:metallophosphoesterase family protein [Adhaeribacter radiodurans]|uniref:Metallophosphoesterase family protein n=1 Tax=Adhaeribacter radiodurans TaxID=2745197 RepID=A0A7L7L2C3_9BACT|nr:metallophosphoesterase family protein [Adhaeribacter radiodurans]QMU26946.1 metallophosphoesterase family protein [Adhaeribacter radiodurans]